MTNFIILGTDTDAGKTTFALLWLHLYADQWEYWKPVESGDSDSALIKRLTPGATVHPPLRRLEAAVAPPLAARLERASIPAAREIAAALPQSLNVNRAMMIETFGSPFSPLNEDELQVTLLRQLRWPCILVSSSRLGCIGRTLQTLVGLEREGIEIA